MNETIDEVKSFSFLKQELNFKSYALLTFWIIPLIYLTLFRAGLYPLLLIFGILLEFKRFRIIRWLRSIIYSFTVFTFGVKLEKRNEDIIRYWWFFTIGLILSSVAIIIIFYSSIFIIPAILIIINSKIFLRYMFIVTVLPRTQYVWMESLEEKEEKINKYNKILEENEDYLAFIKPKRSTHIISAILLLIIPFMISFLIIPVSLISTQSIAITETLLSYGLYFAVFGFLAFIPYLIFIRPIRGFKLVKWVNTKLSVFIVSKIAGSSLHSLPMFSGEFYIEKRSEILDMSSPTAFFNIFKRGRLTTIILTPLAILSILFKYTIINIAGDKIDQLSLTPREFILEFIGILFKQNLVIFSIFVLIPLIITILYPLIWSLYDSEIKRAKWRESTIGHEHEISDVEDVGKTINNLIKIFIGVGSILNLVSIVSSILVQANPVSVYVITFLILILGGVLIIPGTLFFSYLYFSSGDHADGVNYIRYTISNSPTISVGTIVKNYSIDHTLSIPPKQIAERIGLNRIIDYSTEVNSNEIIVGQNQIDSTTDQISSDGNNIENNTDETIDGQNQIDSTTDQISSDGNIDE